ncbi:DUF1259 domain-containing protein [Rossellomorea vietnamensis]|uniref:DUF1259 domain-containing protein n=1 Tax=Rossellomorea vietnamensis TaxID=218284 RepID=A0A6I6UI09_9BACI|nr:DUF1259 domain-containing protein [Rossellomorea vietnamensis]QHE62505.1 DUF1259 domain-containing protein [Rossellomorea vietnamensis]
MNNVHELCTEFGKILNGKAKLKNGVCSVSIDRNLYVTIQGRLSRGELKAGFSFESLDQEGRALNLGEVVLLEEEIQSFSKMLIQRGLIVSALHNHWLFTHPDIMYIHFQSVEPPLQFAHKAAEALSVLKK